jgi:hypothetical protein
MNEKLDYSTFEKYLHDNFQIQMESSEFIDVELIKLTDLGACPSLPNLEKQRVRSFSLVFRGPAAPLLPQKIYPFSHPEMGEFELFIVPIGPDQEGLCYEAVFN